MPPTLDLLIEVCSRRSDAARSTLANLQWYDSYTEKGYDSGRGIIVANWNDARDDDTMKRLGDILERLGYVLDWEDTTIGCDHCNRCICTEPQHAWDYHHFHVFNGFVLCEGCITDGQDLAEYCDDIAEHGKIDRFSVDPTSVDPSWKYLTEIDLSGSVWDAIIPKLCEALNCGPKDLLVSENAIHARGAALRGYCRLGKAGLQRVLFCNYSLARS